MVVISVVYFGSKLTDIGILGVVITVLGATWYSIEELNKRRGAEERAREEQKINN